MTSSNVVVTAKHFTVYLVADGVYAAIANQGTGAMANAGFVDAGESVIVFDSMNTQQAAAELRQVATELTGKPISHLINSHWHGDHVRGNQAFRDVNIVASDRTRELMQEIHPERIATQQTSIHEFKDYILKLETERGKLKSQVELEELHKQISTLDEIVQSLPTLELVLPTETFESKWSFQGTARTVECYTLGSGHTGCDSILYLPTERICFIGDLIAIQNHMLIIDGDIHNWIGILEKLKQWEIDTIVPGHGPIGGKEWILEAQRYLRHVLAQVNSLTQAGRSTSELSAVVMAEQYQDWSARELYAKNLQYLVDNMN